MLLQAFHKSLCLIPRSLWLITLKTLVPLLPIVKPKIKTIALRNLSYAFPEKTVAEREAIFKESLRSFARVIVDGIFLHTFDSGWVERNVRCDDIEVLKRHIDAHQGKGMVLASGHLGSFELLGHVLALRGVPIAAVARDLKPEYVNRWWRGLREGSGNRIISRKGALKGIIQALRNRERVGLLVDQNVRDKHAIFAPWFGRPAATTGAVALAALRTGAPIFMIIIHREDGRYAVRGELLVIADVSADRSLTLEEKATEITVRMNGVFEKFVREHPAEWFWMHDRYRTKQFVEQGRSDR